MFLKCRDNKRGSIPLLMKFEIVKGLYCYKDGEGKVVIVMILVRMKRLARHGNPLRMS